MNILLCKKNIVKKIFFKENDSLAAFIVRINNIS